jgi:hypothetical protein
MHGKMTEKLEDRKIWGGAVQRRDACERRARFFGMHSESIRELILP